MRTSKVLLGLGVVLVLVAVSQATLVYQPHLYGCYTDVASSSSTSVSSSTVLTSKTYGPTEGMNLQLCLELCSSEGYFIYGLKEGTYCYCANETTSRIADSTVTTRRDMSYCRTPCAGNLALFCGGPGFTAVYLNVDRALGLGINLKALGILDISLAESAQAVDLSASQSNEAPVWAVVIGLVGIVLLIAVAGYVWYKAIVKTDEAVIDSF
eukprot:TRINITY_DN23311_c0_g1_i1.p1 TRINITY_DN23311_c0_g1~~TRINITY_DN23311_c0_g1_i1.p1  ORF type:complete len:211 (+),score=13.89 TRINITY_DN23311_c0_g1_i1:178-810(+)